MLTQSRAHQGQRRDYKQCQRLQHEVEPMRAEDGREASPRLTAFCFNVHSKNHALLYATNKGGKNISLKWWLCDSELRFVVSLTGE